jgi:hypothetical protein
MVSMLLFFTGLCSAEGRESFKDICCSARSLHLAQPLFLLLQNGQDLRLLALGLKLFSQVY